MLRHGAAYSIYNSRRSDVPIRRVSPGNTVVFFTLADETGETFAAAKGGASR
jgi:hypothetical protein